LSFSIAAAFIAGLFSTLHCVGMCGGIIGALTFSLPSDVRANRPRLFGYLCAYSIGRIGSYMLAGGLLGAVGASLLRLLGERGHTLLAVIAALLLSAIGLYIAGWFPKLAQLERLGVPLWRRLGPLGRRLLPVRSPWQALAYGAVWGWLPCGMAYGMAIWAASHGEPLSAMAAMGAFGVGTLPAVIGAGILSAYLGRLSQRPTIRKAAGLSLIVLALAPLLIPPLL